MRVLRYDVRPPEAHGGEDGFVRKPDPGDLADPRREARLEELARALEGQVLEAARGEASDPVDPLLSP